MKLGKIIIAGLSVLLALQISACCSICKTSNVYEADIIVYGGTSGAVTSAIQSAREGKSVILVSPDKHLGAMSSAGLTFTDAGRAYTIGGISREFYRRVYEYYQDPKVWNWLKLENDTLKGQGVKAIKHDDKTMWIFEPKVAERIYNEWIAEEKNITVFKEKLLDRENGVKKNGTKIVSIKTLDGDVFKGKVFIDATFEGDLMAASGCSYHVGRESNSVYNENWNGAQPGILHHDHYFYKDTDPYKIKGDKNSGLIKHISDKDPGKNGQGDNKLQAYCFRLCMSIVPENMRPFPKPDNYNADDYLLVLRTWEMEKRRDTMKPDRIPNGKTDTNNKSAFSFDFIGANYDYPDASYEERAKIIKAHKDYQQGLLYFIMNDPRVDPQLRSFYAPYGLAKDEFVDNDNWPYNLYIREARRMIGEYVMTEHDCTTVKDTPKSIGMGSYTLDSHNCQRYITPQGYVQNEGDIGVKLKKPYKISYGALTPKRNEVSNLLVPTACSASHMAYGSIRMEPVFMLLGHSSATAAAMAIDANCAVQDVDYKKLRQKLLDDGQILEWDKPVPSKKR